MKSIHSLTRRRVSALTAAVMFTVGALLVSLAPGAASAGTVVSASSAGGSVGGASFVSSVTVNLVAADELNGFAVTLTYNPAVAVPASVAINSAWTIPLPSETVGATTITVAASRLGFCTGSCPLFTITWNAVGAGAFQLTPTSYTLTGRDSGTLGDLTATSASAGTITVAGPPQPSATATSTQVVATSTAIPPTATVTSAPATITPVPPTTTPMPPTSTAVPTSTPSGPALTATATATATTTVAPAIPTATPPAPANTPQSGNTPSVPAPTMPAIISQPEPPSPDEPGAPAAPPSSVVTAPRPGADGSNTAPGQGAFVPLPPRSGDSLAAGTPSPLKRLGIALMVGSGIVFAAGLAGRKPRASLGVAVDTYLDNVESKARHQ